LVKIVECAICEVNGLLPRTGKIIITATSSFVEVEDAQVVEATEDVECDFGFGVLCSGKCVMPCESAVLDSLAIVAVPIEMFGNESAILHIRFHYHDVLANGLQISTFSHL
jgi:hypothetical protein